MLARLLISLVIFLASTVVILGVLLAAALIRIRSARATGLGIVVGSPGGNLVRILVLAPLGSLSARPSPLARRYAQHSLPCESASGRDAAHKLELPMSYIHEATSLPASYNSIKSSSTA
jgi:hypothetical protein